MGISLAIHHHLFKLVHDSLWPPYNMEAFCLSHHPFKTSHFLERSMTYPARLQKTYWLSFVRTNITLWLSMLRVINRGTFSSRLLREVQRRLRRRGLPRPSHAHALPP